MKETEINIAIAEACGWTAKDRGLGEWACVTPDGEERSHFINQQRGHVVYYRSKMHALTQGAPDYYHDLNAMHEAEELFYSNPDTLEGSERMRDYSKWLCSNVEYPLRSKAAQRAEAFLKTIGKWRDEHNVKLPDWFVEKERL